MHASRLLPSAAALRKRSASSLNAASLSAPLNPYTRSASSPTTGAAHAAIEFSNDLRGDIYTWESAAGRRIQLHALGKGRGRCTRTGLQRSDWTCRAAAPPPPRVPSYTAQSCASAHAPIKCINCAAQLIWHNLSKNGRVASCAGGQGRVRLLEVVQSVRMTSDGWLAFALHCARESCGHYTGGRGDHLNMVLITPAPAHVHVRPMKNITAA